MTRLNYPQWWSAAEPELRKIVSDFFVKMEEKLNEPPEKMVKRKNPFLFRTKAETGEDYAAALIEAFLSSSEETVFGGVLESMATVICRHAKGGRKSGIEHIDLEYDIENNTRVIVQIKSGIHWGNSSQRKSLRNAFQKASRILRQGNKGLNVRCIEGCCYGPSGHQDLGHHERLVGNEFWQEISDWDKTSVAVLNLVGEHASNDFHMAREQAKARVLEYLKHQQVLNGDKVLWGKLLDLVLRPKTPKKNNKSDDESTLASEM